MIAVSNLARSLDFYQKLFGPPIRQGNVAIFSFGRGRFFGVTEVTGGATPGYLSYGMAIENFNPERTKRALEDAGVKGVEITTRGDTPELWVLDPSGIKVQLTDARYAHGSGPLGDVLPAAPRVSDPPPFAPKSYSHMTLTGTAEATRQSNFYKNVIGLHVQTHQAGGTEMLALGAGPDFVYPGGGFKAPKGTVGHCCFAIENYDPQRVMGSLIKNGLGPVEPNLRDSNGVLIAERELTCWVRWRQKEGNGGGPTSPMGTPELYFLDPDRIHLQFSDVRYCGGSGFFGEICRPER
jgi:catechol 2,3-dioxygenase-like lactoylglutathione lyase family enzyme